MVVARDMMIMIVVKPHSLRRIQISIKVDNNSTTAAAMANIKVTMGFKVGNRSTTAPKDQPLPAAILSQVGKGHLFRMIRLGRLISFVV
jgi:hypothetical protein